MLQKLRDKTSGWIATVILGLLMIPFLFVIDNSYLGGVGANNVAKVQAPPKWWSSAPSWWPVSLLWQHHEVSTEEFRTRFEQARMQARQEQGDAFDPREFESVENKLAVLDQLIDEQVLRLASEDVGIVISDATVRDYIANIPAFQRDGKFDVDQYRVVLAQSAPPRTPAQFEQLVRTSLQQSIIPTALAESGFATKGETERLLKLLGETRDVEIALLPEPAEDTTPVTDEQVKQWYEANTGDFRQPETVSIEYVELRGSDVPPVAVADEATLRRRYEDEKARFVAPEQRLASHILIQAGADEAAKKAAQAKAAKLAEQARQPDADFAALATANSDDPGSKAEGGDLGWVEKGVMVKAFEDALFAMQVGDVAGPVETEFGYHVLKLREVQGGQGKAFEEVREQLAAEQRLADEERAFNELSGRLVDLVYKNPTALTPAAEEVGVQVQRLGPFTRDNATGIAANPAVLRAAFSDILVQDGTVSDPIELSPNHTVMIRVTEHSPEQALPLEQARDQVIAAIRKDRAEKQSLAAAEALLKKLTEGQALPALAASENLQLMPMPALPRMAQAPSPAASRAIFAAAAPAEGKATHGKVKLEDGRYAVFAVSKVTPGNLAEIPAEQQAMLKQQLSQIDGAAAAKAYVEAMRKRFRIKTDESQL